MKQLVAIMMLCPVLVFGQAMIFTGAASANATLPNQSTFNLTNFSICAWVNFNTANPAGVIISKGTSQAGAGGWYAAVSDFAPREIDLQITPASGYKIRRSSPLSTNRWHHVVITWKNGDAYPNVYINGTLDNANTQTVGSGTIVANNSSPVKLGNLSTFNSALNIPLDDVRVYSREITVSEISTIANAYPRGTDGITSGLQARFAFAPFPAGANIAAGSIAPDLSGFGNHAYCTNVVAASSIVGVKGKAVK